jgi:hypothetical protein
MLRIINLDRQPVTIRNVIINDRPECSPFDDPQISRRPIPFPRPTLEPGDVFNISAVIARYFCGGVVSVDIETDRGTVNYRFCGDPPNARPPCGF